MFMVGSRTNSKLVPRYNFEFVLDPTRGFIRDPVSNICLIGVKGGGLNSEHLDHHMPAEKFAIPLEPYLFDADLPEVGAAQNTGLGTDKSCRRVGEYILGHLFVMAYNL